ncbi:MAG: LptF/LptG family permease [Phycisphaerales bacterium]|nr:LptF/LptG family permease [Phycisphaerales bacterium]
MLLIDRTIALRFLGNFVTLFCLLYVFAVSIDVVLQFDSFVGAARSAVDSGRFGSVPLATVAAIFDFHGPRVFQFFGFMIGLVSIGAAGFTLAQMQRSRELVALLASGFPLPRVAISIMVSAALLNVFQVLNQEFVIPGLAKMLLREHGQILSENRSIFEVPMTRDVNDNLLYASQLDPDAGEATELLVLIRDPNGTAVTRIFAPSATWEEAEDRWNLDDGIAIRRTEMDEGVVERSESVDVYPTDLSPRALSVRRYRDHAQMLSTNQIRGLRAEGGDSSSALGRVVWSRIGSIGVNLLVLVIVLPAFLRRMPGPLLPQSVQCAAFGIPLLLTSAVVMMVPVAGISPAVMALLPTAVLLPLACWRYASVPT